MRNFKRLIVALVCLAAVSLHLDHTERGAIVGLPAWTVQPYFVHLGRALYAAVAADGSGCHFNRTDGAAGTCTISTTSADDLVFCSATTNGTTLPNISSISSTHTTGWALRGHVDNTGGSNQSIETWVGKAASALTSEALTFAYNGTPTFQTGDCIGISGSNTTTKFDGNGGLPVQSATAPQNMSTSNANDILIAANRGANSANAANGFTRVGTGGNFQFVGYKVVSSTQSSLSVGACDNDAAVNGTVLDAIIQASAGNSATLLIREQ